MITETQETHQSAQSRFAIEAKGVRYAIAASARRPVFRSCSSNISLERWTIGILPSPTD